MGLKDWFLNTTEGNGFMKADTMLEKIMGEIFYKELAIKSCSNLIANTISVSEFLTYEKGKEIRGDNYYIFNIQPNKNQSSTEFWKKVINKMIYENECLVIQQDKQFYIADEFGVDNFVFRENIYKDITVDNYTLKERYSESEVFYFKLHDEGIKTVMDNLCATHSELIEVSKKAYKRNKAKRGTLKIPTSFSQMENAQDELNELLDVRFKKFFEAENGAVLPLTNDLLYEELSNNNSTKVGSDGDRDIRNFIEDIFDFVAMSFQIPPQLLKGSIADTEKAVNNFLTFCINPIARIISDEANRKFYSKENFLERTYIKLDTTRIKNVDITDIAGSLDILLRTGSYTINDCQKELGKEELSDDIGNQRFITKNYAPVEEVIEGRD